MSKPPSLFSCEELLRDHSTAWNYLQRRSLYENGAEQIVMGKGGLMNDDQAAVAMDEALLARAVAQTIRPALIESGHLEAGGEEAYQHHRVIPAAQPLLQQQAIAERPIEAAVGALKASMNLLSHFERMQAIAFLEGADPDAVRRQLTDLLYGADALEARVRSFLAWGAEREANGKKQCLNGTVASYLLAMSDPARYAFCKPTIYKAAAVALLGAEHVAREAARRVAHCTAFYEAALWLFQDRHGLPFTDLMHVHIAFYVTARTEHFPDWDALHEEQTGRALAGVLEAILADYVRVRRSVPFSKEDVAGHTRPMWHLFEEAAERIKQSGVLERHPYVRLSWSVGQGNWARVPWMALLDERKTITTQEGVYVAYLFREDMSGVYLVLMQGVTQIIKANGRREGYALLRRKAYALRAQVASLAEVGFTLDAGVDLRASGGVGADYEVATAAYKLYEPATVPSDQALLHDLQAVLDAYASIPTKPAPKSEKAGPSVDGIVAEAHPARAALEQDRVGRLLLDRLGVILYGPPGTGKTRRSLEIARRWKQWQGEEAVEQVTFHPTYAYEDFVEGFKPGADGQFELRAGLFTQLCDRARDDLGRAFLLLIDEINRGDVARIFGELITLLEKDKRGVHAARLLPYSQRRFWVPPNVYVLGTMNTADRSISLMDIAVRRRFAFVPMRPDADVFSQAKGFLHTVGGVPLAALMQGINSRLLAAGVDRDRAIGHSYLLIREGEPEPLDALRTQLRYDIVPMVEEYCYADRRLVRDVLGRLVDEDGHLDEAVFADDDRLVQVLRQVAGVSGAAGAPEESA